MVKVAVGLQDMRQRRAGLVERLQIDARLGGGIDDDAVLCIGDDKKVLVYSGGTPWKCWMFIASSLEFCLLLPLVGVDDDGDGPSFTRSIFMSAPNSPCWTSLRP